MPGLLGGQAAFKRTVNDKTYPLALARLARRVRHFMLRRTKAQVAADLPPRSEEDIVVEPSRVNASFTTRNSSARARCCSACRRRANSTRSASTSCNRSCACGRFVATRGCSARAAMAPTAPRSPRCFDQLEPILAEGHKVLVFSQFVSLLEILQRELTTR